jgi:hypothetical protein
VSAPVGQAGLPRWAKRDADDMIEVDPDLAYPVYLALLGVQALDQFWLEVARRCLTTDLKALLGTPLCVRILAGSGRYALAAVPPGGGAAFGAATFRTFYARIEGRGLSA